MSRRLTRAMIGAGIALSLFAWAAGRVGEITIDALRPTTIATHGTSLPHVSVHLSVEVRP